MMNTTVEGIRRTKYVTIVVAAICFISNCSNAQASGMNRITSQLGEQKDPHCVPFAHEQYKGGRGIHSQGSWRDDSGVGIRETVSGRLPHNGRTMNQKEDLK